MKNINVLYTTDHNYAKYMLVSLYSLLENNQHLDVTVHVICDKFEMEDYKRIEYIISLFKSSNVFFYSFEQVEKLIKKYNIPDWRGTKIANARLFFTECIKNVDKLLYLDSDTVVVDSLSGLELYDGLIHMVQDDIPKQHWKSLDIPLEKYCNSGVIWFDVNKWKEENCDKKLVDTLKSDISYTYPDQDILNMALRNSINLLPPEYNLFSIDSYFNFAFLCKYYKETGIERYSKKEIINSKKNPVILHSTPCYYWRPWEENQIHPYSKIYDEYLEKIYGEVIKEKGVVAPNPLLFKLYLYSKLICPSKVKEFVKKIIIK